MTATAVLLHLPEEESRISSANIQTQHGISWGDGTETQ